MVQEQTRKGPWTEQEDIQLVFYVNLFGDRRWDFIAKVSGLKRTGKSCRLRWVNYLHPDLKSGKLTTQEERLVLELHTKWGNRWSRIARKLPGRTDNEIKNYWRTYMRKKAQEKRKAMPVSSSSTTTTTMNSSKDNSQIMESITSSKSKEGNFCDTTTCGSFNKNSVEEYEEDWGSKVYSMDDIWRDFELSSIKPVNNGERYFSGEIMGSPVWDVSLWGTHEEEESMMFTSTNNHL